MKILFLGMMYDTEDEKKLLKSSKVALQGAANKFQWNIIRGLASDTECHITVLNSLPVGAYPLHNKEICFNSKRNVEKENINFLNIGFINLPLIKQINRTIGYKREVNNYLLTNREKEINIIIYSLYLPFLISILSIKKKYPKVQISIIIPDLPLKYGIMPKNILKKLLHIIDGHLKLNLLNTIDKFILLTEEMKKPLNISERSYIVIEGMVDEKQNEIQTSYDIDHKKIVLYTGSLDSQFGIIQLVESFKYIDNDKFELWLCGKGDSEEYINEAVLNDPRIKYYGYISQSEVKKLQLKSTIVVNPRTNSMDYTKYSFPSKTMEYLLSTKPVLMHKLDGIPKEYDDYLNYFSGNSPEEMSRDITKICLKSKIDREKEGERNREFILREKNNRSQAKKIINFLKLINH